VTLNEAAKAAGCDSISQGNRKWNSSQAFDNRDGAPLSNIKTDSTRKKQFPCQIRGGSIQ
jgi:hypothetical protein